MLGVGILITVLSVMNGFEKELRDKILSFTSHVNIYPSDRVTIKDLENIIDTDKNIKGYSIVQKNEVLLSSDEIKNIPVIVHNVNQDLESNASEISDLIIDGKFKLSSPQDIVIGNILANNLRVSIGDKISSQTIIKFSNKIHLWLQEFLILEYMSTINDLSMVVI